MKKILQYYFLILGLLAVGSCESEPVSSKDPKSGVEKSDSILNNDYSITDSISSALGIQDIDACRDYLEMYIESKSKVHLDSAIMRFEVFSDRNKFTDSYIRMGVTCEYIGEMDLAKKYYREGKSVNLNLLKNPDSLGYHANMLQLYDYYFAILLNQEINEKELSKLHDSISKQLFFGGLIPEGYSRQELLEEFTF